MNYHKNYVAGLCLLPTYLVFAIVLSRKSLIVWCIGMLTMLFVSGNIYRIMVLKTNELISIQKRYIATFLGQIIFWPIALSVLKYY
jgi:hypothetical protein